MKKTIYVCDKCGAEFTAERDLDTIYIPYDFKFFGLIQKEMELCHECQNKWAQFGKKFLAERDD